MKRFALLALLVVVAACGSDSSAPTDRFDGIWSGDARVSTSDTNHFVMDATQTGSAVAGNGIMSEGDATEAITFHGTTSSSSVNLTLIGGNDSLTYTATFVRSDSVVGMLTNSHTAVDLSLKKH